MMRVRTIFTGGVGGPYLNTTHWTAASENDSAATIASNAMQAFWNGVKAFFPSSLTWAVQSDIPVIDPATGDETAISSGPLSNTGAGTATNAFLPEATQGHLVLRTAIVRLGRRVHGGLYVGPLFTGAAGGDGAPTSGFIAALATASAQLFVPTDADLVVWSRPRTVPAPVAGAASIVTSISVTPKFASLRSRRD